MQMNRRFYSIPRDKKFSKKFSVHFSINDSGVWPQVASLPADRR